MKEWKAKQEVYHRLNAEHEDDLNNVDIVTQIVVSDNIVADALRYFNETDVGWIYPAKSYAVAIMYANWITEDYHEMFYEVLNDPDLLYGNDPYFVPYMKDKETYDQILKQLTWTDDSGMVPDIRSWYDREFGYS